MVKGGRNVACLSNTINHIFSFPTRDFFLIKKMNAFSLTKAYANHLRQKEGSNISCDLMSQDNHCEHFGICLPIPACLQLFMLIYMIFFI